jgi:hypothetical protein
MNLLWDMVIDGAAVVQAALARYSISLFGLTSFWSLSLKALGGRIKNRVRTGRSKASSALARASMIHEESQDKCFDEQRTPGL